MWAFRQIKAGTFGPTVERRGRAMLVELSEVEAFAGQHFTPAQLAAAGIKQPDMMETTE
jgi:hypothetical protein